MANHESGAFAEQDEAFHFQLQQLENVLRELSSKGEIGEDPSWIQEYASRIFEVGEALTEISRSQQDGNPSHKSYR